MIDLLLAFLGPASCPWCTNPETPVRDWLSDHLPYRLYAGLKIGDWDYNYWVGVTSTRPVFHGGHN